MLANHLVYTTVMNNIFFENVRRFVALIGGVEVKFKHVVDGGFKSVQIRRGFYGIKNRQLYPMSNAVDSNNGSANVRLELLDHPSSLSHHYIITIEGAFHKFFFQ